MHIILSKVSNNMDIDKTVSELNKRFEKPLPEFYKRRIVFWYDEEKEFEESLNDISIENAKLIKLTGSNYFEVKRHLLREDPDSNYLVYCPIVFSSLEMNPLADIVLYSEEFRSDLISIWSEEMHIESSLEMRDCIKQYRKYLNSKDRRAKIANQFSKKSELVNTPIKLHLAIMSAICGLEEPDTNGIIRRILSDGLDDTNEIYKTLDNYDVLNVFLRMVFQGMGYESNKPSLKELATHILVAAASRTLEPDCLPKLDSLTPVERDGVRVEKISESQKARCYDFISDWLRANEQQRRILYDICVEIEELYSLPKRLKNYNLMDLVDTECFPCVNECILNSIMTNIVGGVIDSDLIIKIVEKRKTMPWYEEYQHYYEGILQLANMQKFYQEHAADFHYTDSKTLWEAYASKYYQMDTFYRRFQVSFQKTLTDAVPALDDLFKGVSESVEALYVNSYLMRLEENWLAVSKDSLEKLGYLSVIDKQTDFYKDLVKDKDYKVFVVISDGMRYDVGMELERKLAQESKCSVKISPRQAIFPTETQYGMAALLPHGKLSIEAKNDTIAVFADGKPTSGIKNREEVLKAFVEESVAIQYKDLIAMKRKARQEVVAGKKVVYIYHDRIDEMGHSDSSQVCSSCSEAVDDLAKLVKIITNDFGGANIIYTSDHGFLYTGYPLTEETKISLAQYKEDIVDCGKRHVIMKDTAIPDYMQPVKLGYSDCDYAGYAPCENVRIKVNGGNNNYVHGGVSLQEMMIPVIEFKYFRNSSEELQRNRDKYETNPVGLNLVSASGKITNLIASFDFCQTEPVDKKHTAATFKIYFEDSTGNKISDEHTIIADKEKLELRDRVFRIKFNIKNGKYNKREKYYLVIEDVKGEQLPKKSEFVIDLAFGGDDFNFFN